MADNPLKTTYSEQGILNDVYDATNRRLRTDASATVTVDSEFPAAGTISADAQSAPTTTSVYAFPLMWNGATWDRLAGSAANGLTVNTELNAAGNISADAQSAPTTASMYGFGLVWNGTNWDRNRGFPTSSSATFSAINSSTSTTTLLALNANRKMAIVFNNSSANLYVQFSAAAATATATEKVAAGANWEMPTPQVYSGVISGIWDAANGIAQVTEY